MSKIHISYGFNTDYRVGTYVNSHVEIVIKSYKNNEPQILINKQSQLIIHSTEILFQQ